MKNAFHAKHFNSTVRRLTTKKEDLENLEGNYELCKEWVKYENNYEIARIYSVSSG